MRKSIMSVITSQHTGADSNNKAVGEKCGEVSDFLEITAVAASNTHATRRKITPGRIIGFATKNITKPMTINIELAALF